MFKKSAKPRVAPPCSDEEATLPENCRVLVPGSRVAVTGAGGYTGRVLTRALVAAGIGVVNLTHRPDRGTPHGDGVESAAFAWDQPEQLERALAGCSVLFNTYWIRFPRGRATHQLAVQRSKRLFAAARRAGVGRIVHVSIAKPSAGSRLSYYRGKAEVERALMESGVPHTVLRPTVLFGCGDILINNIAWCVRRFPFFLVPGNGRYLVQPLHVSDFATALAAAAEETADSVRDAVGQETFPFRELVLEIAAALGRRVRVCRAPRIVVRSATAALGAWVGDVVLTMQEIEGLCSGLLATDAPPIGSRRLTSWLRDHADDLGAKYTNEVARHYGTP